jgi:hypothetical protein
MELYESPLDLYQNDPPRARCVYPQYKEILNILNTRPSGSPEHSRARRHNSNTRVDRLRATLIRTLGCVAAVCSGLGHDFGRGLRCKDEGGRQQERCSLIYRDRQVWGCAGGVTGKGQSIIIESLGPIDLNLHA